MIKHKGDPVAAVILLIMIASLVFYLFSIPEEVRQEILPPMLTYNNTWLVASSGVVPTDDDVSDVKMLSFPSITLDNTLRSEPTLLSNQFLISSGVYSLGFETLSFNIEDVDKISDAKVSFLITGKEGSGQLGISINGQRTYSAGPGKEQIIISLPKHVLQNGINYIQFTVTSPGLKIWQKNSYSLSSVNLHSNKYSSSLDSLSQSFSLSDEEVVNAESAELNMYVHSFPTAASLDINLNGVTLFKGVPASTFSLDIPANLLKTGQNQLTFSAGEGGSFGLSFVVLKVKTKTIEGGLNYFFTISSYDWNKVQGGAYTCEMVVRKTTGSSSAIIQLNSHTKSYYFSGGQVMADVCDYLQEGSNKLTVTSDEPLTLAEISVGIRP